MGRNRRHIKGLLIIIFLAVISNGHSLAQQSSGFQWVPKLGIGISRNFLLDVGLIGYSYIPNRDKAQYYDANISLRTLIGKHTMLMPKLELNAALFPIDNDELITFNIGADAGLLTDFKRTAIVLAPKAGFAIATGLVRINYLYNFLLDEWQLYPGLGRHAVLLEINISAFQGKGLKMM